MKPLYGKGGEAVFRLTREDLNFGSLYDLFAVTFREPWVVQKFLPAVKEGDKRIILVDGEFAGAINRVPAPDDLRSNMVRGGVPKATDLTAREREICARLGPSLHERGLLFVGIDVIGGYLTEINVTSPTGIRAVKSFGGADIARADLGQDRGEAEIGLARRPGSRRAGGPQSLDLFPECRAGEEGGARRPRRSAASSIAFNNPASGERCRTLTGSAGVEHERDVSANTPFGSAGRDFSDRREFSAERGFGILSPRSASSGRLQLIGLTASTAFRNDCLDSGTRWRCNPANQELPRRRRRAFHPR